MCLSFDKASLYLTRAMNYVMTKPAGQSQIKEY